MGPYLHLLAARAVGSAPVARPRLPTLFGHEPAVPIDGVRAPERDAPPDARGAVARQPLPTDARSAASDADAGPAPRTRVTPAPALDGTRSATPPVRPPAPAMAAGGRDMAVPAPVGHPGRAPIAPVDPAAHAAVPAQASGLGVTPAPTPAAPGRGAQRRVADAPDRTPDPGLAPARGPAAAPMRSDDAAPRSAAPRPVAFAPGVLDVARPGFGAAAGVTLAPPAAHEPRDRRPAPIATTPPPLRRSMAQAAGSRSPHAGAGGRPVAPPVAAAAAPTVQVTIGRLEVRTGAAAAPAAPAARRPGPVPTGLEHYLQRRHRGGPAA